MVRGGLPSMKYDIPMMWCYQSDIDTDTGSHPHPTGYEIGRAHV